MSQIPDPNPIPPAASVPPPGAAPAAAAAAPVAGPFVEGTATADDKSSGMLCWILSIFWILGWVGPLIIWNSKKHTSAFINDQGKEVLNWQFTILPIYILGFLFCIPVLGWILGLVAMAAGIANLVFLILGAISANKGVPYRVPFSIKYIK